MKARILRWLRPESDPGGSLLDRVASLPAAVLVGSAVAVHALLSLAAMSGESVVNDEVAHLPAGYSYLKKGDFRLNPEHPPLVKIVAALPLLLMDVHWHEEPDDWGSGQQWRFGYRFLYLTGNDPDRMLFWARAAMLPWTAMLLAAVYFVTRRLFGTRGAFVSLALTAFLPELLAHGHYVNTDAAITALLFVAAVAYWKFCEEPSVATAATAGLAAGLALLAKFSAVLLLPALPWMLLVARMMRPSTAPKRAKERLRAALRGLGWGAILAGTAYVVLWAGYGFEYDACPGGDFRFGWRYDVTRDSLPAKAVMFARDHRLLPESFLQGFWYMYENAQGRHAFALGRYSTTGWAWYFPFAFLVKTPAPTLALMGWGLVASIRRNLRGESPDYFLIIPMIFYWVLACSTAMNIGSRHILPVAPFLLVLAGGIDFSPSRPAGAWWTRRAALGAVAATVASVLFSAPYFLAYFNEPSRLLGQRHELLVDSSLDWGQDLGRLKRWMDREGIESIKLSYRGNASARALGLRHEQLRGSNIYGDYEPEWLWAREVRPGDWVAISATNLVGVLFDQDRDVFLKRFHSLTPAARIGHSILVYRIPEGFYWKP